MQNQEISNEIEVENKDFYISHIIDDLTFWPNFPQFEIIKNNFLFRNPSNTTFNFNCVKTEPPKQRSKMYR